MSELNVYQTTADKVAAAEVLLDEVVADVNSALAATPEAVPVSDVAPVETPAPVEQTQVSLAPEVPAPVLESPPSV